MKKNIHTCILNSTSIHGFGSSTENENSRQFIHILAVFLQKRFGEKLMFFLEFCKVLVHRLVGYSKQCLSGVVCNEKSGTSGC